MKVSYQNRYISITEAIEDAATPSAYNYSGQLEKLASENEKLREIVGKLVECMYGESYTRLTPAEQLSYILGYGYEVEE